MPELSPFCAVPFVGPARKHPAYKVRSGMISRCHNPNATSFRNYGARGIYVCNEWRFSPLSFVLWAINSGYKPGLQIDRIDNNGPYSPENCRFVTAKTNMSNKRNNIRLSDGSVLKCASEKAGVNYGTVLTRIKSGMFPDDAVSVPLLRSPRPSYGGRQFLDACSFAGIKYQTVDARLRRGWSMRDALHLAPGSKRPSKSKGAT